MREFSLINTQGKVYKFAPGGSFLYDPEGLGFEYDNDYIEAGNQHIIIEKVLKQKEPKGTIKFNTYKDYNEFVKFAQYMPLSLVYKPEDEEYRLDCYIKELEKEEITDGHWLHCDIKFEGIGQWYKYVYWESDPDARGKTYSYKYPFTYTNGASGVMAYQCDSLLEGPIRITVLGPVKNPRWIHSVDGVEVATGLVNCDIPEGHRLVVSSVIPFSIIETDSAGRFVRSLYADSDFATERFLTLKLGYNRIAFFRDDALPLYVAVEAYDYYESV